MKNTSNFNKEINRYYEKQEKDYSKKFDLTKSYASNTYIDNNGNHIIELIHDNKVKLKAEYELIGMYNIINSMWYWGWSIDLADRNLVKTSKKITEFPEYIKKNMDKFDLKESEDLHFKTSMASFYTDISAIDKLIKTFLYYLNAGWYLTLCHGRNNSDINTCSSNVDKKSQLRIEYLVIKKILTLG